MNPLHPFQPFYERTNTYRSILSQKDIDRRKKLGSVINKIYTRYTLTGRGNESLEELQDSLRVMTREDTESLSKACRWFSEKGFTNLSCPEGIGALQ